MVRPVDRIVPDFARAGAAIISFHPEASEHVDRTIGLIQDQGCKAGLAFNPATPLVWLTHVIDRLDLVLVMSVNPGFGGQSFIPYTLEKCADLATPLSLYLKLANQRYTFLLESVVGGERFGRYSFIGLPAKIRIRVRGRHVEVEDRGGVVERFDGDPLAFLREYMRRFRAAPLPGLPRFCGGL